MSNQTNPNPNPARESRRTVYPGPQVRHLWANDCARDIRGGNVSTRNGGATLYCYATPIAHRMSADAIPDAHPRNAMRFFLMRAPFYSKTTAKHLGQAHGAIPNKRHLIIPDGFQWDGGETLTHPDGLLPPLSVYGLALSYCTVPGSFVFHGVTCVNPDGFGVHRGNYAALHARALADLPKLKTARKYGNPNRIAEGLAVADLYRETFMPGEPRLPIPADAPAIVSAWRKRIAATEARAEAEAARLARDVRAWEDAHRPVLAALRAYVDEAKRTAPGALTLSEKITAWEASGDWPAEGEETHAETIARHVVNGLIKGDCLREDERIPEAVRRALPSFMNSRGHPGINSRKMWASRAGLTYSGIYEAAGVQRFNGGGYHFNRATVDAHRHLIRLSADGSEIITSGGARVPVSIARLLWKRHGALMREAVNAASVPAFPGDGAPIPFGSFHWTAWEAASEAAREAGAGAWLLRVGCHLISPADLCRMAERAKWEEVSHA